jgi:hypothetical protein
LRGILVSNPRGCGAALNGLIFGVWLVFNKQYVIWRYWFNVFSCSSFSYVLLRKEALPDIFY